MDFREIRKENNLSQQEIAKILEIDQKTYSNYENNKTEPTISSIIKMADYFDVSLDYLVGRQYNNNIGHITTDENELICDYRKLNQINKIKILSELKGFLIAQN